MTQVRFVEGATRDFVTVRDCEWPIVPRVGEFVSTRDAEGGAADWMVTRLCHVMGPDAALLRTLVWVERQPDDTFAREEGWMTSYDHADNDDPYEGASGSERYSTPTD